MFNVRSNERDVKGRTPKDVVVTLAMGRLTTHVLDLDTGRPAVDVKIELFSINGPQVTKLAEAATNADGRTDTPLLEGVTFTPGIYELHFFAGPYLAASHRKLADPPFLDTIVIRFGISADAEHYHVPLLLAANGYSTYRGS